MRILLIEDEQNLANFVAEGLQAQGFNVDVATDGSEGAALAAACTYDMILLDILLPAMDGMQVLQSIRATDCEVPVLMLTAKDSVQDKVNFFEAGADDYLTKPFSFAELLVRVRAQFRRRSAQQTDVIRVGDFELDRLTHKVKRADKLISFSNKEYALLEYLALNAGQRLSRNMIVHYVWGRSFESVSNIVDIYIRQLRVKLRDDQDQKLIRSIRGIGYIFGDEAAP